MLQVKDWSAVLASVDRACAPLIMDGAPELADGYVPPVRSSRLVVSVALSTLWCAVRAAKGLSGFPLTEVTSFHIRKTPPHLALPEGEELVLVGPCLLPKGCAAVDNWRFLADFGAKKDVFEPQNKPFFALLATQWGQNNGLKIYAYGPESSGWGHMTYTALVKKPDDLKEKDYSQMTRLVRQGVQAALDL